MFNYLVFACVCWQNSYTVWLLPYLFGVVDQSFPGGSVGKESVCNAGDLHSIPGLGRAFGEGNDNPLNYSFLENSMDRGASWVTVHGITKSQTQLSD